MRVSNSIFYKTKNIPIYYLLPLLAGGLIAVLVCLDYFLTNLTAISDVWKELGTLADLPYLFSALVILVSIAIPFLLRSFWKGNQTILIGIILTIHLEGIALAETINLYEIFLIIFLLFWLAKALLYKEDVFISSPIFALNIALFSFVVLSFSITIDKISTIRGIIAAFLRLILLFFLVINYIRTREQLLKSINILFVIALLSSIAAIIQFGIFAVTGEVLTLVVAEKYRWVYLPGGKIFFRAAGLFSHPNMLGSALAPAIVLMLYFFLSGNIIQRKKLFGLLAICMLAVMLSFSRSSWLGIALVCLILPYLIKPSSSLHYTLILLVLVACGLATGVFSRMLDYLLSFNPGSDESRILMLEHSGEILLERPFLGIGINAYEYYPGSPEPRLHNAILEYLCGAGLFAGFLYCSILILIFIRLLLTLNKTKRPKDKILLKGMICSFIALLVDIQVNDFAFSPIVWFYLALFESSILILGKQEKGSEA